MWLSDHYGNKGFGTQGKKNLKFSSCTGCTKKDCISILKVTAVTTE